MNLHFAWAGVFAILLVLTHSVGGELFLFPRLTKDGLPPLAGDSHSLRRLIIAVFGTIGERGRRLLRVTWHIPSILGCGLGLMLLELARPVAPEVHLAFIEMTVAISFFLCGLIALIGTRSKHPGWAVFFLLATLVWLGTP